MAIIERDVILQGKTESGQSTLDFPITRLSNIEASSDIKSKPEAGDYLPIIDGQDDGMKMVPVETLLPKEDNYVRSNKNFLRNAIFKHPVNRRGKTTYAPNVWNGFVPSTIDLWGIGTKYTVIIDTENQCLVLKTSNNDHFFQKVINQKDILGKTITISALIDRDIAGNTIIGFSDTIGNDFTNAVYYSKTFRDIQPGLQIISYTVQLPDSLTNGRLCAYIQSVISSDIETAVSMKIYGMKVELGDTQTLARMNSDGVWELIDDPDYAEEYAYCEKYDLDDYSFVGDYHVNENLIPNWDFRHPMNSQGKTEYGVIDGTNVNFTPLYTIDDWIIDSIGAKVTIKEGCINYKNAIINDSINVHCFFFRKKAKYFPFKKGDLISISLLCKLNNTSSKNLYIDFFNDSIENAYNNGYQCTPVSLESNKLTLVHIINEIPSVFNPEDTIKIGFFSDNNVAFDIDIYAIKLELGSVSTLAHLDSNGRYVIHNTNSNMVNSLSNCFDMYYGEYYPINRSNPNLLDNWYFIDPINQEEQVSYSIREYIMDRWLLGFNVDSTASVTIHAGEYTEWAGYGSWLIQRFPDTHMVGKLATLSVLFSDGSLVSGSNIHSITNNIYIVDSYFNIPGLIEGYAQDDETEGIWRIVLVNHSATPLKIVAVKFESGPVQTLARQTADGKWVLNDPPPDRVLELLKCQKYQWITENESVFWLYRCNDGVNRLTIHFPVAMRDIPNIQFDMNTTSANEIKTEFITNSTASFYAIGAVEGKVPSITKIRCKANL